MEEAAWPFGACKRDAPGTPPAHAPTGEEPADARHRRVREDAEAIRDRSEKSGSWRSMAHYVPRLINHEGVVPVRARVSREDVVFLASARDDVLALCEITLRLLDLHQPADAGGISSDPASPVRRCTACMWRWPCPTFRLIESGIDPPAP